MAPSRWRSSHFVALLVIALIAAWQCPAAAQSGQAELQLTGGLRQREDSRETWVVAQLSLPLGDFGAGPRARQSLAEPPADASAEPPADAPQAEQPAPERASLPEELNVSPTLVKRLVRRALAVDGARARARRLASLASRSKSSAWLPELSLRAGRSTDRSLRLTPTSSDPYRYTQSDGSDLYGEVKLSWKLNGVVFQREEVGLARLRQSEQARRDQVVERVLEALFAWQLAELRAVDPNLTVEDQLRFQL
ncbi:MAG: hypothetical protein KC492_29020, partial [Myxococcales bacterium]|nr:hypothetical protein [Myxococcales bacterium]